MVRQPSDSHWCGHEESLRDYPAEVVDAKDSGQGTSFRGDIWCADRGAELYPNRGGA
jgi:hypothetical protein